MEMRLLAATPDVELLIATAMLTTSSDETPADIYVALKGNEKRVHKLLKRLILKHGSVLEHNRLVFLAEADENEVLALLLAHRFFEVSRLEERKWLLSCNLRTVLETLMGEGRERLPEGVREALITALKQVAPRLHQRVMGRGG